MNDLACVLRKVLWVADHTIVKPSTHCNQHIAVLHRHIGFVGAMHARHANKLLV